MEGVKAKESQREAAKTDIWGMRLHINGARVGRGAYYLLAETGKAARRRDSQSVSQSGPGLDLHSLVRELQAHTRGNSKGDNRPSKNGGTGVRGKTGRGAYERCMYVCVRIKAPPSPIRPDCMSEGCAKHAPPV